MDIYQDTHFQDFIKSRTLRKTTITVYQNTLQQYCKYQNKTPTELIEEAEKEEDMRIRMKNRKIKKHLLNYYQHLQDRGINTSTIKKHLTIIRTFYTEYEIELPKIRLTSSTGYRETIDDIPTPDNIRLTLENCNKKYQSIILIMASSGMGRGEVLSLKIKDLKKALNYTGDIREIDQILDRNSNDLIAEWNITRGKTGMPYTTFSSPESIRTTINYLHQRPNPTDDEPLFVSTGKKRISDPSFAEQFRKINNRCGFGKGDYHYFFRSHKLRKYFASTLIRCKIPQIYADWMLGHHINPVTEAYFKADVRALKSEYLKVLPELSFKEKVKSVVVTEERLLEIEEENRQRAIREQEREKELEAMKKRDIEREKENKRILNILKRQGIHTTDVEEHQKR